MIFYLLTRQLKKTSVLKDFSPMLKDNKEQQDKAQDLLKSLKEEFDVTLTPQSTCPQREVDDENKVKEEENISLPVSETVVEASPVVEDGKQTESTPVKKTPQTNKNMAKFRAHSHASSSSQPACTLCNIL